MDMHVLPAELMELQLAQIDLLLAMYPDEGAIVLHESSQALIYDLRVWISSSKASSLPSFRMPDQICALLNLDMSNMDKIQLEIFFPLKYENVTALIEPPSSTNRLKQPPWMSKAQVADLNAMLSTDEDLHTQIEHAKQAVELALTKPVLRLMADKAKVRINPATDSLTRAWFYFPSISTRSKRDDLITNAPHYHLTGFLLAGKPGILCLEGSSRSVDEYMSFIKTVSWGDIPAGHKKVSERLREEGRDIVRVFEEMREVTDEVGERRGERANRTDLRALEKWLGERGLGEVMRKVII
jgi:hypothetical protein